jgi:hypothetical protein
LRGILIYVRNYTVLFRLSYLKLIL